MKSFWIFVQANRFYSTAIASAALSIVVLHYFSQSLVPPIHDASNCISRAANLSLLLARGDIGEVWRLLLSDLNNFLSVLYLGIWNLIIGPGRVAWGWTWLVSFLVYVLVIFKLNGESQKEESLLGVMLLLGSSALFSPQGGLLDQRFDPLSAMVLSLGALALLKRKMSLAILLTVVAVYLKGPAVPISLLMWLSAWLTGVFRVGDIWSSMKKAPVFWSLIGLSVLAYGMFFIGPILKYNLMAVNREAKGSVLDSLILSWNVFFKSYDFYFKEQKKFSFLFVPLILFIAWTFRFQNSGIKRQIKFGSLFFIFTYLIFSVHPVKATVLLIWFLPSILPIVLGASQVRIPWVEASGKRQMSFKILVVAIVSLSLGSGFLHRIRFSEFDLADQVTLEKISQSLVNEIQTSKARVQRVLLLVNFLFTRGERSSLAYDSLRVLLFERLGRNAPVIDGWELGTFSDNWLQELESFKSYENYLIVLGEDPLDKIHPFQRGKTVEKEIRQMLDKTCTGAVLSELNHDWMGPIRMYRSRSDLTCE